MNTYDPVISDLNNHLSINDRDESESEAIEEFIENNGWDAVFPVIKVHSLSKAFLATELDSILSFLNEKDFNAALILLQRAKIQAFKKWKER